MRQGSFVIACFQVAPACQDCTAWQVHDTDGVSHPVLQDESSRRSGDGAAQHRSTVDPAELQQAPALKPLKINKNNFAGLEAQGEGLSWRLGHHCLS